MMITNEKEIDYTNSIFRDYPDMLQVKDLPKILPNVRLSKAYNLIREKQIYSIKLGSTYVIPKISVIEYLFKDKDLG